MCVTFSHETLSHETLLHETLSHETKLVISINLSNHYQINVVEEMVGLLE